MERDCAYVALSLTSTSVSVVVVWYDEGEESLGALEVLGEEESAWLSAWTSFPRSSLV